MRLQILTALLIGMVQISFAQLDSLSKKQVSSNNDTSNVFTCAYLEECSLTTSNSSKIWCTELSIKTNVLANYAFPIVSDSSTFVNREKYMLSISINSLGKVDSVKITGCSNPIVSGEIVKACKMANFVFFPAKDKSNNAIPFVYHLKLRSFIFSRASLQGLGSPQKPMELSEEEQQEYEGKSLRGYRVN